MAKSRYSLEFKVSVVRAYLDGENSERILAEQRGLDRHTVHSWIQKYREQGEVGLLQRSENTKYTAQFKVLCVKAVLSGEGSVDDIVAKYNISCREVLRSWIKRYNANKELKDYNPKREVYMADARRKTTLEERKEITEYCMQKKNLRPKIFSQKYRKIRTSLSSYCAYCYPLQLANFDAERKSLADFLANFRVFDALSEMHKTP